MNQKETQQTDSLPVVLTIASSDSGGGTGIQADLKTFSALNVYGTSAITCVTAQNPEAIMAVTSLDTEIVTQQIQAVCDSFPVRAAKTGMLYSADIIHAVAQEDVHEGIPILVVDPVMVEASGKLMFQEDTLAALCDHLLPLARVVTPNIWEAELLSGYSISSEEDQKKAACKIGGHYGVACVLTGGHLPEDNVVDVVYDEGEELYLYSTSCRGS
ncbi:MAG: bifunctional hydroxymethylpyrimidine kinase/phosphomethylpyrimidine kinase [Kiritimatiellae bacterium]|nr:bifunctional hydroxymethylpyrimidine kinase/phosphomethylpyrimidine kinase [Kiritimatiellia bacterium]